MSVHKVPRPIKRLPSFKCQLNTINSNQCESQFWSTHCHAYKLPRKLVSAGCYAQNME
ncbi:uncharacterized protein BYT42DRAFT_568750 [Radiomyces spectabilis]|uniref:uncharacterized protein n=1 Tax=Radiomyces spectabilis TaxID=64574 RepID=UPI00222078B4|nr:uncharacterized protein BYT42DRAFT_568750 [Radiomyces spectabilis]KAI8379429.1 hypothetical protein BYT42DRAFT_568750 [Radiomyces spectabilis]